MGACGVLLSLSAFHSALMGDPRTPGCPSLMLMVEEGGGSTMGGMGQMGLECLPELPSEPRARVQTRAGTHLPHWWYLSHFACSQLKENSVCVCVCVCMSCI